MLMDTLLESGVICPVKFPIFRVLVAYTENVWAGCDVLFWKHKQEFLQVPYGIKITNHFKRHTCGRHRKKDLKPAENKYTFKVENTYVSSAKTFY